MTALQSAREQKNMLQHELRNWEFMLQSAKNTLFELDFRNKRLRDLGKDPAPNLLNRIAKLLCHIAMCEDTIHEDKMTLLDIKEKILELTQ